jgi:hypothetical protein
MSLEELNATTSMWYWPSTSCIASFAVDDSVLSEIRNANKSDFKILMESHPKNFMDLELCQCGAPEVHARILDDGRTEFSVSQHREILMSPHRGSVSCAKPSAALVLRAIRLGRFQLGEEDFNQSLSMK